MRKVLVVVVVVAAVLAVIWKLHGRGATSAPAGEHGRAAMPGLRGGVRLAPSKPASLAGRVTRRSDGAGVAGAVVAVARADFGGMIGLDGPPLVATTDANGAWLVPSAPPGPYVVSATATGYLPSSSPHLTLASDEQRTGIALVLDAGGTLVHGTVSDIGGGPVADARVQLRPNSALALDGVQLVAMTGADGTYQITVRDGPYDIEAVHEAYAHKQKEIDVTGKPLTVDFKLVPGATIHGVVIARDTNKPVPHAMISVSKSAHRGEGEPIATTNDDGTFTLTSREPGVTAISAKARGYASMAPTIVRLGIGEQIDGVRVLVDHAFSISGHVVVKGPKTPIAGVMVGAGSTGGESGISPDPTDADGAFEVIGIKPGSYMMFAISQDAVPDIGKPVQVVDKDVSGVEIELDRGATLSGRVDPPGAATVTLELAGDVGLANIMQAAKAAFVHGDADPTGVFRLEHVPSGSFKLTARTHAGPAGTLPIVVAGVDQSGLVVKLEARGSIAGRVVDSDGAAVGGIKVTARPGEHEKQSIAFSGEGGQTGTTSPDGSFTIVGLDAATYEVVAADSWEDRIAQSADKSHKPVEVEVAAGAAKTGVVLTIQAKNGAIRGQVTSDGQPAPDAWVTARSESVHLGSDADQESWSPESEPVLTDETGKFAIRGLVKGTYTVIVDGPKGASRAEQKGVNTGDTVSIQLAPLGTLTGHVTVNGAAVTTFDLSCKGPAGPVDHSFFVADGAYTLDHLAPGPYTCSIDSDSGTATGTTDVPVDSATLDFTLSAWGQVSGTVVSMFDGSPVANLSAIPQSDEGRRMTEVIMGGGPQTDANGRFVIDRLQGGTSTVLIYSTTTGMVPLAHVPYTLAVGQHLDVGAIKVVPPRTSDAGTFGFSVAAQSGALIVTFIKPGGPAEAAGLVVGDSILTIDGRGVVQLGVDQTALYLSSGTIGIGQVVQLGLARGGSVTMTSVKW